MGFFVSLVGIAGMAALGIYGYQKLKGLERDIRHEMEEATWKSSEPGSPQKDDSRVSVVEKSSAPAEKPLETKQPPVKSVKAKPQRPPTLENRILEAVAKSPGILQADLYDHFPEQDRRVLQKVLLGMDREELLERKKEKSTYKLFTGKKA